MDSLGEVGKKMRSAIKAKLVELGNASSTGYIDDELPDYVMIMVANKRPKQQMLVDLNLFLGSNTETFVNWLHQVLQKLQEVTLPTNLATKAKKKISETSGKKDKKKDKKKHPKEPSITDVIAVELMEKAKKTIDPKIKCEKSEKSRTPSPSPAPLINNSNSDKVDKPQAVSTSQAKNSNKDDDDDLGIPTLSEMRLNKSSNALHKKELGDLQNTEKKIQELKRSRRAISGPEDNNKQKEKELSDHDDEEMREVSPENDTSQKQKPGVKSRLGTKPVEVTNNSKSGNIISLSAIRRSETEFLKKIVVKQKEDNERKVDDYRSVRNNRHDSNSSRNYNRRDRRPSRSNSRDRHRNRSDRIDRFRRRTRSRSPLKSHESRSRLSIRDRIGDKIQSSSSASVIINRKQSKTPEADLNFKVKSRPALSSTISTHAGKSMLLRAMADAQRSTQASSDAKKKQRDNITVQVKNEKRNKTHLYDEEYIPESISGHSESEAEYHPSYVKNQDGGEDDEDVIYLNNNDDVDLDDLDDNNEKPKASPQFIVTIDQDMSTVNRDKSKSHSPTPPKVIKRTKRTPVRDRIGERVSSNRNSDRNNKDYEHRSRKRPHQEIEIEVHQEVEESEAQRAYNKVKKTRVSPIKFDLTDDEDGRISRSSSRDPSEKKSSISKNDSDHNGEEQTKRIRLETSRSFDHVPALLSSIAVPVPESSKPVVTKSKDRCKFYPNCSNTNCIYFHPTLPCKVFPNCKFGDNCAYTHPQCKFDRSCHRVDCNYTHSSPILPASTPAIASSIVPVQNYKSITLTPTMQVCKFFPSCTNTNCIYQHPKVCKFGKACANKYECNFYHFETASKSKFRWVSSTS